MSNPYTHSEIDPYAYNAGASRGESAGLLSSSSSSLKNPSSPQQQPVIDMEKEAMRLKMAELQQREAMLNQREAQIQQASSEIQPKNWPKCRPCIYHDIDADCKIPELKPFVHLAYKAWMVMCVFLGINLICAFINASVNYDNSGWYPLDKAKLIIVAAIITAAIPPANFFLSYKTLYNVGAAGSSAKYVLFFIGYGLGVLYTAFLCVGLSDYGACGIVQLIRFNPQEATAAFVANLIMTLLWFSLLGLELYVFLRVYRVYRASKNSLSQARDEFQQQAVQQGAHFASNAAVQQAVGGLATQAVTNAIANGANQQV